MKTTMPFTAIIEREGESYVALCPEVDIASQGETVESARKNLVESDCKLADCLRRRTRLRGATNGYQKWYSTRSAARAA